MAIMPVQTIESTTIIILEHERHQAMKLLLYFSINNVFIVK